MDANRVFARMVPLLLLLNAAPATVEAQSAVDFSPEWNVLYGRAEFEQADRMLDAYLRKLTAAVEAEHEGAIATVKNTADLERFQTAARERLRAAVGALPGRSPLNSHVTGTLDRGDYFVEKLLFESRPRFYVTANVYVPRRVKAPFPAVLANVGHWGAGKAYPDYQRLAMYLARRGFLVLVYDLPGMGERVESWDPVFRRPIIHPGTSEYFVTTEHGLAAGRTILTSGNLVSYLLWDALRGLDYLESRNDVDGKRIAVTGISGGGWLTELLTAYDPRVRVAIPVCYGGCIADNLFRASMTVADVDALIAPRPLLMMEATGDSRSSVAEKRRRHELVARLYEVAGAAERTQFRIFDGPHGFTDAMFPVAYSWLTRWLPGIAADSVEEPRTALETEADLAATLTGQVRTSIGGETLSSLNRARFRGLRAGAAAPAGREQWQRWQARLRRTISGKIALPSSAEPLQANTLVRADKGAYTLEKLVYYSEPGIYVPALLLLPRSVKPAPGIIFVNDNGKSAGGVVERYLRPLVEAGRAVLAIDVRGAGETGQELVKDYADLGTGEEAGRFYSALRVGRNVLGMRAYDVLRAVDYLEARKEVQRGAVAAVGSGSGGLLVLYAAALDDRIRSAAVTGALLSYASIVEGEIFSHPLSDFVQDALQEFDLPDLAALVAPRPLLLLNPVDEAQRLAGEKLATGVYRRSAGVYAMLGAGGNFTVRYADSPAGILESWKDVTSAK
ncbi:MAG TPA: alpha/beta fold hydrolase [Bryobacteraceae bacterium]|nr:alpha/beta fold hydrolase [Bryobacteraceae bacterium]